MNHQLALSIQLNDEATLADFCWENNPLLRQQTSNAIQGIGEKLYYIWGSPGSGKTHLLQACCQAMNSNIACVYLPLNILKKWGPQSIEGIANQDFIAIDDMDVIAQNTEWEEALFHLYNKIRDNGKTILMLTGTRPPTATTIHLADLRSRLSWGLVTQINELSDELKMHTLKQRAIKRGFDLPTSVCQFLINRCARNMHDLHHLLDRLDEASLVSQRKITVPFVKAILNM